MEEAGPYAEEPKGTEDMRTLSHLMFAHAEMERGAKAESLARIAVERMWEAERRHSCEVSGPPKITRLPLGIHLVAETQMSAKEGWVSRASIQIKAAASTRRADWARRL